MDVVRIGAAVEIKGFQCEAPDGQSNETGGKVGKQCMSTYTSAGELWLVDVPG